MVRPSFIGLIVTGFLNLIAVILLFINYKKFNSLQILGIVLLLSISIGTHAKLHAHEEIHYGFNPLESGMKMPDNEKFHRNCPYKNRNMMNI